MNRFKVGDRVIVVATRFGYSQHLKVGLIAEILSSTLPYLVHYIDGDGNAYDDYDLEFHDVYDSPLMKALT